MEFHERRVQVQSGGNTFVTHISKDDTPETCGPGVLGVGHPHLSGILLSLGTAGLSDAAC